MLTAGSHLYLLLGKRSEMHSRVYQYVGRRWLGMVWTRTTCYYRTTLIS